MEKLFKAERVEIGTDNVVEVWEVEAYDLDEATKFFVRKDAETCDNCELGDIFEA
jgi:hypothetical protein